jgi:hypothetical protein
VEYSGQSSQISNMMRDYSRASDNLYPLSRQLQLNPALLAVAYPMAPEIARLKTKLLTWCTTVLYSLAAQGVTMPTDPQCRTTSPRGHPKAW